MLVCYIVNVFIINFFDVNSFFLQYISLGVRTSAIFPHAMNSAQAQHSTLNIRGA